jgi:nitrogen fixation protein FixH
MRELTGRHVLAMFLGGFGVIIAVNLLLAYKAVSTFPGVEVDSSYAEGIGFDARRAAQVALNWDVTPQFDGANLRVDFRKNGQVVHPQDVHLLLGRVTEAADDHTALAVWDGSGFAMPLTLAPGLWRIDVSAQADDGTAFRRRLKLQVRP